MKCWRWCYCCCSCWSPSAEKNEAGQTLDDSSSLIQEAGAVEGGDVHAFYVPRRHSSFHTSTYNTVAMQPGRSHSDSCSSSGEDEVPEQRGRCWSTIPTSTDVASLVSNGLALAATQHKGNSIPNFRPPPTQDAESPSVRNSLVFDKHTLCEIRESDRDEDIQTETEGDSGGNSSTTPPSDEVYGYLSFLTQYDEQEQRLSVFLDKVTSLPKKSSYPELQQQQYSTFVRLSLTSSKKNFLLSRTARNTLSPVFKEEHIFHTNRTKWKSACQSVLRLSLYDCDRQGRHDAIGHVLLPLARIADKQEQHCLPLTPMSTPVNSIGQLLVSLFYSALQSRLSVNVIKARHLRLDPEAHKRNIRPLSKGKETLDTFVKVTLMCGGQKVKTNRSQVTAGDPVPSYNHKSDFVVPPTFLPESSLVVTVVAKGVLGRSVPLGRVTAGPYVETGNGVPTHWGRMVQETRSVVQWRNLYL